MMLISRIKTAAKKPYLIKEYARNKLSLLPYKLRSTRALPPSIVYFVVNSTCNMRCLMCDVGQQQKKSQFYKNLSPRASEMDIEAFRKAIEDMRSWRPDIVFSSTEPLLYKKIIEAIQIVKHNGMRCRLATNGYLLKQHAKELAASGLDELIVSVDGPAETHNRIRGIPDAYARLHEGLLSLARLRKGNTPRIRINITITELNYDRIADTIESLKEIPVYQFSVNHLNFVTPSMARRHNKAYPLYKATPSCISSTNLESIDASRLHAELQNVRRRYANDLVTILPDMTLEQIKDYYGSARALPGLSTCTVPWRVSQVCVNGDVIPLTRCMNAVMGNAYKQGIRKVWNGTRYRMFRKLLQDRKSFPACSRCCGVF
jgi:Fe-coproporphyrin III synthase